MIIFDKDEHVLLEVRKHWFIIISEFSTIGFFALLPLVVSLFISLIPVHININGNIIALFIAVYAFWLLICWIVSFILWTNYYLDIWIITNKRLIDIDQYTLFKREVSVLELDKIQDITSEVKGVLATILNYGNVTVQTAGSQKHFLIKDIEKPNEVREKIQDALLKFRDLENI